uniref:Peptidase C14 caspase domain-containing protein n=2 Tax=Guillardia theta TaxID=55529 RepID=A0A7S4KKT5_GUITH|mmetsp:Transcript_26542/g.87184  ORF Transcript_26542/g.87184 Transcript_26542/m.87184 type:complete len:118 (+) Transcript_26542:541-894(+)
MQAMINKISTRLDPDSDVVMLLDTCRVNFSQRGHQDLEQLATLPQTWILYATKESYPVCDGPDGGNSPFTRAVLRTLKELGPDVEFYKFATSVNKYVRDCGMQRSELKADMTKELFI